MLLSAERTPNGQCKGQTQFLWRRHRGDGFSKRLWSFCKISLKLQTLLKEIDRLVWIGKKKFLKTTLECSLGHLLLSNNLYFHEVKYVTSYKCLLIDNSGFTVKEKEKKSFLRILACIQSSRFTNSNKQIQKKGTETCRSKPHSETPYLSWLASQQGTAIKQGTAMERVSTTSLKEEKKRQHREDNQGSQICGIKFFF